MTAGADGARMQLPPQLETKFAQLIGRYPVKRSALIPMMLYAEDYYGFLGDDILTEIALRLDLNFVQVTETLAYYSMLRRKPVGKNNIQVCTNVSCMLRGANEIYAHLQKRLEIGHKEVTSTGTFSLEEVECIGACTGAPAMQVNYDFYENLTTDSVDKILEQLQSGEKARPVPYTSGSIHKRRRTGKDRDQPPVWDPRLAHDRGVPAERRLQGARKILEGDDARAGDRRSEEIEFARPRRRRIPDGNEMELRTEGQPEAEIRSLQRR